jgi:hypothetical protein
MKTIHANQANKQIRSILSENLVVPFFHGRSTLMSIVLEQCITESTAETIERMSKTFCITKQNVTDLAVIYGTLANTIYNTTEKVNAKKSVTSERSLLGKLTDGSSHLKIYPHVDFNHHTR